MTRFRSFAAFLTAFVLLFSAAYAENSVLDGLEVEEISFEDLTASGVSDVSSSSSGKAVAAMMLKQA